MANLSLLGQEGPVDHLGEFETVQNPVSAVIDPKVVSHRVSRARGVPIPKASGMIRFGDWSSQERGMSELGVRI